MSLFGLGKKRNEETNTSCCCCKTSETAEVSENRCTEAADGICCIKVLGVGCKSCHDRYGIGYDLRRNEYARHCCQ